MTGIVVVLTVALVTVAFLARSLMVVQKQLMEERTSEHAKCIAHVADVTSRRVVALALREYARRWDSIEEVPNLTRLRREEFKVDGPGMPAIWLNQQADLLDPQERESQETSR